MTEDAHGSVQAAEPGSARAVVEELVEAGLLDRVIGAGGGRGAGADR